MPKSTSIIVGAGLLGKRLYDYLDVINHDLITISKSPKSWSKNHICIDLLDNDGALPKLPKFEYLYIVLTPVQRDQNSYIEIYIKAIKRLLSNLSLQNLNFHCVFVSSISVYSSSQTGLLNENTQAKPDNFRGESLLQAESSLKKLHPSVSIIRAAGLYSNQRPKLIKSLLNKDNINIPKYLNLIHEDDLCQWIWLAAKNRWPLSIAADGAPFQRRELHQDEKLIMDSSRRIFKSQFLPQIQLKFPNFKYWLSRR